MGGETIYAKSTTASSGCMVISWTGGGSSTSSVPTATGVFGQAISMTGGGEYLDIGVADTALKTLSFWLRTSSSTQYILDLNGTAYIRLASTWTVTATGFTSPTIYVDGAQTSTLPSDGDWHHIAVTTETGITLSNVRFGYAGSSYFDGKLDEIRFYSSTLTTDEVKKLKGQGG